MCLCIMSAMLLYADGRVGRLKVNYDNGNNGTNTAPRPTAAATAVVAVAAAAATMKGTAGDIIDIDDGRKCVNAGADVIRYYGERRSGAKTGQRRSETTGRG